jgi:hypothetical protein
MMYRTFLLAIFVSLVLCTFSTAQTPAPPPPALIYSAPDRNLIREFVDEENNFRAAFPGTPKKETSTGENVTVVSYKVSRKGSASSVSIGTFPTDVSSRAEQLIAAYKNELGKRTVKGLIPSKPSNIAFERELQFGSVKGKEFGYESDLYFTQVAVFVLGNRMYEIKSDVTNWHILTDHYPEIVEAFYAEATRFRNSFSLLK